MSSDASEDLARYGSALYATKPPESFIEVRIVYPDDRDPTQRFYGSVESLLADATSLLELNRLGGNVYIGVGPRLRRGGTKEDVAGKGELRYLERCLSRPGSWTAGALGYRSRRGPRSAPLSCSLERDCGGDRE